MGLGNSKKKAEKDAAKAEQKKKKGKKEKDQVKEQQQQQQEQQQPAPDTSRPTSVGSASEVSLDPVSNKGEAKKPKNSKDEPKNSKDEPKKEAKTTENGKGRTTTNTKLAEIEANESRDSVGEVRSSIDSANNNDHKKKRLSDNIASRLSTVETAVSAGDSKESLAEINTVIERLQKNDSTLTEVVLNNQLFFATAEKEQRLALQTKLAEAVTKNIHVHTFSVVHNYFDDEFAVTISQALTQNKSITSLNLESNNITGVGAQALANMLTANSTLKELRLNNQKFTLSTEGEEALMHALEVNETLIKLNLNIRDLGIRQNIEKHLSANLDRVRKERYEQNKEQIVVPLTDIKRKVMSIFTDNYEESEADFSHDMEFQKLKEEEKLALAQGFAKNTRVKVLKMNKCGLRDSFAEELGKSLKTNLKLEVLSLETNSITGTGVVALAEGLKDNTSLKELRLQGQTAAISTEGEEALAAMLDANQTLLKLGLQVRNPTARERIDKALRRNNDLVRQQRQRASAAS